MPADSDLLARSRRLPPAAWVCSAFACLWLVAMGLLLTGWNHFEAWTGAPMVEAAPQPTPTAVRASALLSPEATSTPVLRTEAQPEAPAAQPPASQPAATAAPAACPTASMSGFGLALFNEINAQRTANGQGGLAVNPCVVYVAQLRSNDMAANEYFSHTGPDGSTAFSLLDANNVDYGWGGENLARNNYADGDTVAVAIRDLMASAGHRENILNPHYTEMGVAAATDASGIRYYTMIFIGPA